jgi:AbiV family abortive infection protein
LIRERLNRFAILIDPLRTDETRLSEDLVDAIRDPNRTVRPTLAGSYHIAFHLATMALEEIGKSSMIFLDAIDRKPLPPDEEAKTPLKWVDDHERKLFWAIWLPGRENLRDWHTIPAAMEFARGIHKDRLDTLYIDPSNLNGPIISAKRAMSIIAAAEARLNMERLKEFREMGNDEQDLMHWFFAAMDDPRLKPMIFSKGMAINTTMFTTMI